MSWQGSGLDELDVAAIRQVLATVPAVASAVLYGSRAMQTHRPGSDIDLALVGDQLNHGDLLNLSIALDDLLLPYKIDLSLLAEIDNRALLDHIQRVGKPLYNR